MIELTSSRPDSNHATVNTYTEMKNFRNRERDPIAETFAIQRAQLQAPLRCAQELWKE